MWVLELGGGIAGSYAGMLLRSAGVDVVRVEVAADCWLDRITGASGAEADYLAALDAWLNVGKRRVAFADYDVAAETLPNLVSISSAVVDDLDPDRRALLGLAPILEPLAASWVSVTPYGLDGEAPPGSDLTAAALSAAVVAIGRPEREPLTLPHFFSSVQGGTVAATLAVAALGAPGPPRHLDVSIAEVVSAFASMNATLFDWRREGHRAAASGGAYPYTLLPAKDESVLLAARSNAEWRRMVQALGGPAWANDARFRDVHRLADDTAASDAADALLTATLADFTGAELLARAAELGCAIAPARTFDQLIDDPELRAASVMRDVETERGVVAVPGFPWLGAATDGSAATVGEHNQEVSAMLEQRGLPGIPSDALWRASQVEQEPVP